MNDRYTNGVCQQIANEEAARANTGRLRHYERIMKEQAEAVQAATGMADYIRFGEKVPPEVVDAAELYLRAAEARHAAEMQNAVGLTGEMVGLDASLPAIRTFTRAEVLTALRALKADTGVVAGREALDRAVRVFERME